VALDRSRHYETDGNDKRVSLPTNFPLRCHEYQALPARRQSKRDKTGSVAAAMG